MSGYADGGDAPDKQLELVPGAVKDAESFLSDKQDTAARFDRVAELVEGFETPFGLQLFATVHWVTAREKAVSAEDAIDGQGLCVERAEEAFFAAPDRHRPSNFAEQGVARERLNRCPKLLLG